MMYCLKCEHKCRIEEGHHGKCGVIGEGTTRLVSSHEAIIVAERTERIENIPFYHYKPNSLVWAVGFAGCNFHCPWCHNYHFTQEFRKSIVGRIQKPEDVLQNAIKNEVNIIAFTYNEPTIATDFIRNVIKKSKEEKYEKYDFKFLWKTNGYMTLYTFNTVGFDIDGFSVDLKFASNKQYEEIGGKLGWVLGNIRCLYDMGKHVEVVTLVVPGINDDKKSILKIGGIISNISKSIPWHITPFIPAYKFKDKTYEDPEIFDKIRDWVRSEMDLKYVYLHKHSGYCNTVCYTCGAPIIRRLTGVVLEVNIKDGECQNCGKKIFGVF